MREKITPDRDLWRFIYITFTANHRAKLKHPSTQGTRGDSLNNRAVRIMLFEFPHLQTENQAKNSGFHQCDTNTLKQMLPRVLQ